MEIKASYRLRSYRVTEYENGLLWWETHFDFGMQRSGECFIYGNILIIKNWSSEKNGLLIGEFLDQLKKLPSWDKTLYYCFASELLDIKTGRKLTDDFLNRMSSPRKICKIGTDRLKGLLSNQFKIDRYLITVNDDGIISWQTPGGVNRVESGRGTVESDIFFLGPGIGDELTRSKQEFLDHLSRLPQWSGTLAWCRHSALRVCREEQKGKSTRKVRSQPDPGGNPAPRKIPAAINPIRLPEPLKKLPSSASTLSKSMTSIFSSFAGRKGFKVSWPGFTMKKFWFVGLIFLVASGMIIGVSIAFHLLEKKFHRLYWFKEGHHEDHPRSHSNRLILLLFLFIAVTQPVRSLGAEERDIILDSGIHYPGGFDSNTVGEVHGKAFHFSRPEKGPVRFHLFTNYGTYTILTCPPWYWNDLSVKIPEGAEVAVWGSKSIGRDGNLYVIAQEVKILPSGPSFLFRVKDGTPVWKASAGPGRESWGGGGPQHRGRR
jgi:hypothetical protein